MLLPDLNQPASIALGVFLIVLGCSFGWKCYQALIKGRLLIWRGWLPFTLISPFVNHLPPGKNSLLQWKEAMWIHVVMGPLFFFLMVLSIAAGIDYVGFPGTEAVNSAMTGGRLGAPPAIVFNKRTGYAFPFVPHAVAHFSKLLGGKIGLDKKQTYYDSDEMIQGSDGKDHSNGH
jgi:hypothetical protein